MNKWNLFSVFSSCLVLAVPMAAQTVFKDGIASVNVTRALNRNNATDQFNLTALNSSTCNDRAKLLTELSAHCVPVFRTAGRCELSCQCKQGTGSFILWEKRCADERKFRRGCTFVFGSWTWANGWSWNSWHDSLQILYVGTGFGLTAGFKASTNTFSTCVIKSTTLYSATGEWEAVAVEPRIVFFKLRGIWHLSWQLSGKESEIEGKFVKLEISCSDKNSVNDSTETIVNSSCVVVKAAGHLKHQYSIPGTTTSSTPIQANITTTTSDGNASKDPHNGLIIGLVVGGIALLLITAVVIFVVFKVNASRVKETRSSRVAMACYKGSVAPEPV